MSLRWTTLIVFPLLVGCAKKGAPDVGATATQTVNKTEVAGANGLTEVRVDFNNDGKPEIVNHVRKRNGTADLVLLRETDLNNDGKLDVRTTYDDGGQRTLEEMDTDFDGKIDWVDHYINGRRSYAEVDTDFNGTFDLFKYYENGRVRRKERDTNADGRIDFWEYLDENGNVVKLGRDLDGDGKMDVKEQ